MAIDLSILEKEDALKNLPDMALQQMLRQPSPNAPPFLVAAELKRREEMAKEFAGKQAAAQTAQQAPTVAHRLAGQQQPMPMSQAGAMAAPPQQPPMPQEAQLAMALSGATGRPPPELPTVNAQEGFSGAAVREIAKALRKEGTRTYAQRKAHQPFSSRERPAPVSPAGLALLLAAIQRQQSEPERASGGFALPRDDEFPRGRGRTVAAARPVTAANGTQGRTVYAQDGFRFSPEEVLDVERMGRLPSVQEQVLRSRQAWAEGPSLGVDAANQAELEKLRADWRQSQADWSEYGPAAEILANFERERLERGGAAVEAVPEFPVSTTTSERLGQIPRPSEGMRNIYGQYGEGMPGPDEGERAADPRDEFIKRVDRFFSESDSPEDTRKRLWDLPVDFLKGIVTEWGPRVATKEDMARRDEAAKVWAQKRDAEAVREIAGASFAGEGPPLPRADPIRDAVSAAGPGVQPWPIPYTSPLDQAVTERVVTETPIRQTGGDAGVAERAYPGLEGLLPYINNRLRIAAARPGAKQAAPAVSPDQDGQRGDRSASLDEALASAGIVSTSGGEPVVPIQPSVSDDRKVVSLPAAVEQRVVQPTAPGPFGPGPFDAAEMPLDDPRQTTVGLPPPPEPLVTGGVVRHFQDAAQQLEAIRQREAAQVEGLSPDQVDAEINRLEAMPVTGRTGGQREGRLGLLRAAQAKFETSLITDKGQRDAALQMVDVGPSVTEAEAAGEKISVTKETLNKWPKRYSLAPQQTDGEIDTGLQQLQKQLAETSGAVTAVSETKSSAQQAIDEYSKTLNTRSDKIFSDLKKELKKFSTEDTKDLGKLETRFKALDDFYKTGKLPERMRQDRITNLLLEMSKGLLGNQNLYDAFKSGVEGFQAVDKAARKEYADGLAAMLTASKGIIDSKMAARAARRRESIAMTQFAAAENRGNATLAMDRLKIAEQARQNERTHKVNMVRADIARIAAGAQIMAAGKTSKTERLMKSLPGMIYESDRAKAEAGNPTDLNKHFHLDAQGRARIDPLFLMKVIGDAERGGSLGTQLAIDRLLRTGRRDRSTVEKDARNRAEKLIAKGRQDSGWVDIANRMNKGVKPTLADWKDANKKAAWMQMAVDYYKAIDPMSAGFAPPQTAAVETKRGPGKPLDEIITQPR